MALAVAELASVLVPHMHQDTTFTRACRAANDLQGRGLQQAHSNFVEQQKLEKALHRRQQALLKELHFREMSHAIEVARREALRDLWSQKNQLIQTLMVIDTVMFSCAFSLAVEATAPDATNMALLRIYSATTSCALGLLFLSIWLAVKLQARMASYDMHRPRLVYRCGQRHIDFPAFFECHGARLEVAAFGTFWVGTIVTVAASALYVSTIFTWHLDRVVTPLWLFVALATLAFTAPLLSKPLLRR
jgi:hypothetical protein